ncbi:MAG: hypothetical protein ACKVWV_09875 [Planctomycetota bacterium]
MRPSHASPPSSAAPCTVARRGSRAWLGAFALVVLATIVRVLVAHADPNFGHGASKGLLKSDPGLAFYLTDRIVESRGRLPDDLRADPRVEHPQGADLAELMPVGLELLCAWTHLALGGNSTTVRHEQLQSYEPAHMLLDVCTLVSALCASLALFGVFGLALELTGSARLALLAALLAACMPANYRTIGFVLVDEDLALPLFALHLWLLARAFRLRTWPATTLAALALAASVASWHAASFLAALEAACVLAWSLATGARPFRHACAWVFPGVLAASALLVPMLRASAFVVSLAMLALAALVAITRVRGRWSAALVALGTAGVLAWLAPHIARVTGGDADAHGHVFDLLSSKVRFLGVLPADPTRLSADTRLMWQGPFATLELDSALGQLGVGVLALFGAVWCFVRRPADTRVTLLALGACLSLAAAWLVARVIVLPGLLLPVLAVVVLASISRGVAIASALALVQLALFVSYVSSYENPWYRPRQRQTEIAELVRAIPALVPENEAIGADFMNSTSILAHTRRPILFQPKWESRRSRARVQGFLDAFFHRSPRELRTLLVENYRCRYLLVDRFTLWFLSRYAAGVPHSASAPPPGSAAEVLLSQDDAVLRGVPGYTLLYRSPASIVQSNGAPTDFFRLYRLDP